MSAHTTPHIHTPTYRTTARRGPTPTRRSLLATGGAGALAAGLGAALAGCGPNSPGGGEGDGNSGFRLACFGNPPVREGVEEALAVYQEDGPSDGESKISTEYSSFDDYWDKLSTQFAAQDGPDVMRMSMTWLTEYAERGTLLALDDLVDSAIDISGLDEDVAKSGVVDGKRYGVGQSAITHACFRNPGLVEELGGTLPDEWSWEDFEDFCADIAGEGMFGSTDIGGNFQIFEVWARANGTELFDGQSLAVGADVIEEWLAMWEDLRTSEVVPPADLTAEINSIEDSPFTELKTAVAFGWVQEVAFYQAAMTDSPLAVADVPGTTAGDISGQFLQSLDFWSVSGTSEQTDAAAELIDFFLNDEEAVTEIGTALGVPPSQESRDTVGADPESAEGKAIDYAASVADRTGPNPEPWPRGYGSIQSDLFPKLNQDVGFGQVSVSDGVAQFVQDAEAALEG